MSSLTLKSVAFYKNRPTSSVPYRSVTTQCVRTCPRCIKKYLTETSEFEDMLALKSFDNLVWRKFIWPTKYQSIQYHIGQFDLLKISLNSNNSLSSLYIVATTSSDDVSYLNKVLKYLDLTPCYTYRLSKPDKQNINDLFNSNKSLAIPFLMRSCVSDSFISSKKDKNIMKAKALRDFLKSFIDQHAPLGKLDHLIIPVVITKDHDRLSLYGLGSICIQLLEPFKLQDYAKSIDNFDCSTHLVQHLCFDLAQNAAIFPPHLAAYLILYLDRFEGASFEDLVLYFEWFKKTSIDTRMQLGFTGNAEKAVQAAIYILKDFIHLNSSNIYLPKDVEKLLDYANIITPLVSYYGLIGAAILFEYNNSKNAHLTSLTPKVSVKVARDKVLARSYKLADLLEQKIPCRLPCKNIEASVFDTMNVMQTNFRFFKVEEPVLSTSKTRYWDGDSDNNEEYYQSNPSDPRFQSWIVLTEREIRLDRLSLFINSVSSYL